MSYHNRICIFIQFMYNKNHHLAKWSIFIRCVMYSLACTTPSPPPPHRTACHSWFRAVSSCWRLAGCTGLERTRLPSSTHTCSIGLKSELNDGHGRVLTSCWRKKSKVTCATCGLALSCWKSRRRCCAMNGKTWGCNIVMRYAIALRRPRTTCKAVFGQRWYKPTPLSLLRPIDYVPGHNTERTFRPYACKTAYYHPQMTGWTYFHL